MGAARSAEGAAAAFAVAGLAQRNLGARSHRGPAMVCSVAAGPCPGILSTGIGLGLPQRGSSSLSSSNVRAGVLRGRPRRGRAGIVHRQRGIPPEHPESMGHAPWGGGDRSAGRTGVSGSLPPGGDIFRRGDFWWIVLSYFLCGLRPLWHHHIHGDYARHQVGMEMDRASLLATIHGACQVIGVLTILPLSDRLGRKTVVLLSNFTIAAAIGASSFHRDRRARFFLRGSHGHLLRRHLPHLRGCAGNYFPGM